MSEMHGTGERKVNPTWRKKLYYRAYSSLIVANFGSGLDRELQYRVQDFSPAISTVILGYSIVEPGASTECLQSKARL